MVRPERFERPTAGTANQCSIQLSYERTPILNFRETEIILLISYINIKNASNMKISYFS
jgi:hypothetical protein